MKNKIKKILIINLALFSLVGVSLASPLNLTSETKIQLKNPEVKAVVCPMDAKKCEDGSFVGRFGENCEFKECPKIDIKPTIKPEIKEEEKPIVCTAEYAPVCANKKIIPQCLTATGCDPILKEKTYSNKCVAKSDLANILYEGPCSKKTEFEKSLVVKVTPESFLLSKIQLRNNTVKAQIEANTKAKEIINLIQATKTEDERRKIFQEKIAPIVKHEQKTFSSEINTVVKKSESQKEKIISEKSQEVFEKFDYFIEKAESTYNKVKVTMDILKSKNLVSENLNENYSKMGDYLIKAKEYRTAAWLDFNMVLVLDDKEEIRNTIKEAKINLDLSKESIKEVFKSGKLIINEIKVLIKK